MAHQVTMEIPLSKGLVAIVDAADYQWLSKWKWCAFKAPHQNTYYAMRKERMPDGKRRTVRMHRSIMDASADQEIDHKDGNGLNNTRGNLRIATHQQNACNRRLPSHNTSGHRGVSWAKFCQKWQARIQIDGKKKNLGYFATLEEAAQAYNKAAKEFHGEFARLNNV